MRVSVLTYHATNISGNDYSTNDHIALEHDLKLFHREKIKIISSHDLIDWLNGKLTLNPLDNHIVLTFDDGSELDYRDWDHPQYGFQKSFLSLLKEHKSVSTGFVQATSFVIASAEVRQILEQTCLGGYQLWRDFWWDSSDIEGLISIENHSWDHVHPTLDQVCQKDNIKEDFTKIESLTDARCQIEQANHSINKILQNNTASLFAYPYGHYNSYLTEHYFPQQTDIKAAFTCDAQPVTQSTNIWKIPRYVCGADWLSTNELKKIILAN